jgi:hypothetical protein
VTFLDRLIGSYERVFDAAVTLDMRGPRRGAAAVDPDRS